MNEEKQSISSHLADLRKCFIRCLVIGLLAACICYGFSNILMEILKKPILDIMPKNSNLVVLAPYEYFFVELKASLFFGLLLALPMMFSQIWLFVSPGLYKNEKKFLLYFVIAATLCFIIGVCFAYFLVFPPTFQFFIDTLPPDIVGTYSVSMLYGFCITILLGFGVIFQTPLAVFLLIIFNIVNIETFSSLRRYIFVASFIIGAILTPPDPISQVMLAIPMYCLFEVGLFLAKICVRKKIPKFIDQ